MTNVRKDTVVLTGVGGHLISEEKTDKQFSTGWSNNRSHIIDPL